MKRLIFVAVVSLFPIVCFAEDDSHHRRDGDDRRHCDKDDNRQCDKDHRHHFDNDDRHRLDIQGGGTIRTSDGQIVEVTTPDGVKHNHLVAGSSLTDAYGPGATSVQIKSGTTVFGIESFARVNNLNYSDFGIWSSNLPVFQNKSVPNFYAAGFDAVSGRGLPRGQAIYNGAYILSTDASHAGPTPFSGSVTITADFRKSDISANLGGPFFSGFSSPSGTINPNGNKAASYTMSAASSALPCPGACNTVSMMGAFYGPGAAETAGTLSGTRDATLTFKGSFGAKR